MTPSFPDSKCKNITNRKKNGLDKINNGSDDDNDGGGSNSQLNFLSIMET